MNEDRFWVLVYAAEDDELVEERAASMPWEAFTAIGEALADAAGVPVVFTTREAAEEALRDLEADEPDFHLFLVERFGEEVASAAWDGAAPLRVVGIRRNLLVDKLEDADFPFGLLDDEPMPREFLIEELKHQ